MKKVSDFSFVIFSFTLSFLCLYSCSNTQESKLVYTETNTIKQTVKEKEAEITWTFELEEDRLTQTINKNSMELGADVPYNKELYKISKQKKAPVYPSIENFGSLDTRNLRTSTKDKITQFCQAFCTDEHTGADTFFNRKYIFNYVFFLNDFNDGWKKNFSNTVPEASKLFTKWIFGEPFNGSEIIQIPVRFYSEYGTIDVTIYLSSSGNNEIYQITIDRWKKV